MANWKEFDNRNGILKWRERNDTLVNGGEDFVCYAFHPIMINLDVVVGEVEVLTLEEYQNERPRVGYVCE